MGTSVFSFGARSCTARPCSSQNFLQTYSLYSSSISVSTSTINFRLSFGNKVSGLCFTIGFQLGVGLVA